MAQEIERKFLVTGDYKSQAYASSRVLQGYICSARGRTVRVRIRDGKGYLTIKGASDAAGMSRYEWEKEIPLHEAEELMRGKIVFSGNIDPSGIIALGTPGQVEEKTRELLEIFRDNPRLILNAGCAIPSVTPSENLHAMIRTTRNFK